MSDQSKTLWHGRYEAAAAESLRKLNDSLPFDKRLYFQDAECSIGYAKALAVAGVITGSEAQTLEDGLRTIQSEFQADRFRFEAGDEDIHTAVERRLGEIVGAVAGKLHTGRSRNDQIATDIRSWLGATIDELA